jgi:C1A family cysteine protease
MTRRYGWKRDLPDHRDHLYAAPGPVLTALPTAVDLRPGMPPVWDQGQLGSCTAHAVGAAVEYARMQRHLEDFMPSRLFIYYNERAAEGTVTSDSGAMIRTGIKVVARQGVCHEALWLYDVDRFALKPPVGCYEEAAGHLVTSYQRVPRSLPQLRGCLAAGHPVVFGFSVFSSFEGPQVAETGIASLPGQDDELLGGHAVLAVGYDDKTRMFLVRNSWGESWGQAGYFEMPYEYLTDPGLSSDFWAINTAA